MAVMKEFFTGLLLLVVLAVLSGIGFLLIPFLLVTAVFLRIALIVFLVLFGIWLLGKIVIEIWEYISRDKKETEVKQGD